MGELGVTLIVVQHLRGRQAAKRGAKDRLDSSGVERPVTAEPGVEPVASPALALARAASSLTDRKMTQVASTAGSANELGGATL